MSKLPEWANRPELQPIIERFREKIFSLRLSEQINYPLIILQQLQQISAYATYDTELWKRAIDELESFIPDAWKDEEYYEEIKRIERIYENTLEIAEQIETEEDMVAEIDDTEYYEMKKQALMNLLNRLGMLAEPIRKDIEP